MYLGIERNEKSALGDHERIAIGHPKKQPSHANKSDKILARTKEYMHVDREQWKMESSDGCMLAGSFQWRSALCVVSEGCICSPAKREAPLEVVWGSAFTATSAWRT
jgi:hypothetical protein